MKGWRNRVGIKYLVVLYEIDLQARITEARLYKPLPTDPVVSQSRSRLRNGEHNEVLSRVPPIATPQNGSFVKAREQSLQECCLDDTEKLVKPSPTSPITLPYVFGPCQVGKPGSRKDAIYLIPKLDHFLRPLRLRA